MRHQPADKSQINRRPCFLPPTLGTDISKCNLPRQDILTCLIPTRLATDPSTPRRVSLTKANPSQRQVRPVLVTQPRKADPKDLADHRDVAWFARDHAI